jgi:hypothetical protein
MPHKTRCSRLSRRVRQGQASTLGSDISANGEKPKNSLKKFRCCYCSSPTYQGPQRQEVIIAKHPPRLRRPGSRRRQPGLPTLARAIHFSFAKFGVIRDRSSPLRNAPSSIATPNARAKFEPKKKAILWRDLGNSRLKKTSAILNLASCFWRAHTCRIECMHVH